MTRPPTPNYVRSPLEVINGIPVFSVRDRYVDNYTKIALDHLAAMVPGNDNPFIENDLWLQLDQSTRALIEKHVADDARVLDVGVGLGRVLGPIDRLQRYGIDISHEYLQKDRENGFEVAFSRIEDMPYEDTYFDALIACDVLEHVIDLHTCCLQMLRVLKPGGLLIIRVPLNEPLDGYLHESVPYEFVHLRKFDLAALRILFERVYGLKLLESDTVAPRLMVPGSIMQRFFSASSRVRTLAQGQFPDPRSPLWPLRAATQISQEEYVAWVYDLRENHKEVFADLEPELMNDLEINVVFKKI